MLHAVSTGYNEGMDTRFSLPSQNSSLNAPVQFDGSSFALQNQLTSTSNQAQIQRNEDTLALGHPQTSTSSFHQNIGVSSLTSFRGAEDCFPEEEIRMSRHEMLETDDMQQLLHFFSMGGHGHPSITEEGYSYSSGSYVPSTSLNYNFNDDRSRSGKAVVGWLKLKAALRWGIFTRKKAAERRAQLVELDDS